MRKKVAEHHVFPMFCGSGGSKSRLARATGAEPCGHIKNEKLHEFFREAKHIFKLKCSKHEGFGPFFENHMQAEQLHTVVARITFWSFAHVQVKIYKATLLEVRNSKLHALRARSAFWRRHGTKKMGLEPLLEVRTSKFPAIASRTTFPSPSVKHIKVWDHFGGTDIPNALID